MKPFQPNVHFYKKFTFIYEMIKSKDYSPQIVVGAINDHEEFHIGSSMAPKIIVDFILMVYSVNYPELSKYITESFSELLTTPMLIPILVNYEVEPADVYEEYLVLINNSKYTPSDLSNLLVVLLKQDNDEYWDLFLEMKNEISRIDANTIKAIFSRFRKKTIITNKDKFKQLLEQNENVRILVLEYSANDVEILDLFFADVSNVFIF